MDILDGVDRTFLRSATPILPTRAMAPAIAFYERLGFQCEPYEDGATYAFLRRDGQELQLGLMETAEFVFNATGVYFVVGDVDVFFDEVVAAGVTVLHEPEDKSWRMREFAVSDPDGALLRFGMPISH